MKIVKIIEIIVILLLSYFNYSVCYDAFRYDKPLTNSFITAIISIIAVSYSFFSNEDKGYFARIKSAVLTFIIFHISVLIAYFQRFEQFERSTFMEYVVIYIFSSLILQIVASSFFIIPMVFANVFSPIILRKPNFSNKKEKTYKHIKNNGNDDKGNVVDGDGIEECENFEYVYDDESGNTESDSEQTVFSKFEGNNKIKYNRQATVDNNSKDKENNKIGYDKKKIELKNGN